MRLPFPGAGALLALFPPEGARSDIPRIATSLPTSPTHRHLVRPGFPPGALGPPQLLALSDRRLSDDQVPGDLREPPTPPNLSPGRSGRERHAPPDPCGPARRLGAVLLTAQLRAPTVGSCGRCGCKLQPAGEESPRRSRRPPPLCAPQQPGACSPPTPTVPPFSPQVLKLSLRGDTAAAAAALLPLLCLPMDMHCKADPFSAMHREYRRPASVPARGSRYQHCPVLARPWSLCSRPFLEATLASLVPPFRSSSFPHFPVFLKPTVSLPSAFCHPYFSFYLPSYPSPAFLPITCLPFFHLLLKSGIHSPLLPHPVSSHPTP